MVMTCSFGYVQLFNVQAIDNFLNRYLSTRMFIHIVPSLPFLYQTSDLVVKYSYLVGMGMERRGDPGFEFGNIFMRNET